MQNKNNDSKKVVIGVVVGGIIGGSALYLWHSLQNEKKPILNKIGKAITDMGEILENSAVNDSDEAIDQIGKTLPKGDNTLNNVLTLVATGINLWNNIKKGN